LPVFLLPPWGGKQFGSSARPREFQTFAGGIQPTRACHLFRIAGSGLKFGGNDRHFQHDNTRELRADIRETSAPEMSLGFEDIEQIPSCRIAARRRTDNQIAGDAPVEKLYTINPLS
jgi:hypothetical protein